MNTITQTTSDLTPYNTLRLPASADRIVEITSVDQIGAEISAGTFKKPFLILGMGANILFTKDFPGTVLINKTSGFSVTRETDTEIFITVASGQSWIDLVAVTTKNGWSGIENMALIPGTAGAAVFGNIGAYGQTQEDVLDSVSVIDLSTGIVKNLTKSDCRFGYRDSIFKHDLKDKCFIASVSYRLSKIPRFNFSYSDIRKKDTIYSELDTFAKPPYTPADVARAVTQIRTRKMPDWHEVGTAGSFFKNPLVTSDVADRLRGNIPELQIYPTATPGLVKLPAARLIDELGWRGKRVGNVGTASNQALCVVNFGNASGREVYEYSESIRADVKKNYGIDLEYEVLVI